MRWIQTVAIAICGVLSATGCRQTADARAEEVRSVQAARAKELARRLAAADADPSRQEVVAKWIVPPELREISGLALTEDGRLLAHDDEVARIYVIDPRAGIVLKRFSLEGERHGDFEAIAAAGKDIYLLQSNGHIFQFREGADGAIVPYTTFDTKLGKECEFESMAYEADSSRLLLACKTVKHSVAQHELVLFGLPLPLNKKVEPTMITIPMADVTGSNKWKNFHPSDMTIDPFTKNYVLIASRDKGMVVISPGGEVVRSVALPPGHKQAEGVAITKDTLLMISDEANVTPAAISMYRWHP